MATDYLGNGVWAVEDLAVSEDSVTAAKAYQQAERAKLTRDRGLRFDANGHVHPRRLVVVACPHCGLYVGRDTEGQAVQAITQHIVELHMPVQGVA